MPIALLAELVRDLRGQGHDIHHVDVGGGLGIPYHADEDAPPLPADYAAIVRKHLGGLGAELVLEPGRLIVGNAGILVTRVEYVKEGDKTFVIVDAAMNDLIRPTLYEAHHDIQPVHHSNLPPITADVVGPVCETGDYLALGRRMPGVEGGRSARRDVGGRLWRGDGLDLQFAAAGARSAGRRRALARHPPAQVDRRTDRARQRARLAVMGRLGADARPARVARPLHRHAAGHSGIALVSFSPKIAPPERFCLRPARSSSPAAQGKSPTADALRDPQSGILLRLRGLGRAVGKPLSTPAC